MASISPRDTQAVLNLCVDAAKVGGAMAFDFFRQGATTAARIDYKSGGSPVTEADLLVDAYLKQRLMDGVADAAWLSEETADDLRRLGFQHVLVVDPIDGTRAFVEGDPQWTVSIALVSDGRPVAGVVHAPALGLTFTATAGGGAACDGAPIAASRQATLDGARLAAPAGFIAPLARLHRIELAPNIPSLAFRFARVADGAIDGAVASPDAHDWDIAAADLIVHEAGGRLSAAAGIAPVYNGRRPRHPTLYAANAALQPLLLAAGRRTLASGG